MASTNHIIIGLGGTGGKIICSLCKLIFRRHRTNDPRDINIGYIYLDTDDHYMDQNNPEWFEMGNPVHLNPSDNIHIKTEIGEIYEVFNNPDNYPGIKELIQPIGLLKKIIDTGQSGKVLGGQKRRLGRICFALRAKEILHLIERKIEGMNLNGEVTFHICCGLAGGTGSGIIVDVISQIRKKYPQKEPFRNKILLYTLLPESHPGDKDFGNYQANGYAAMKELNALALGKYLPIDVVRKRHNDPIQLPKEDIMVPFNCCYVFSNENNKGVKVTVEKDIPEIVGDFIYQKTIGVSQIDWENLKRMENAENADDDHENNNRSLRFMSFGIRRLVFPQEEISDYMVKHLVQHFMYELKFLNWQDGLGWIKGKRNGFSVHEKADEISLKYGLTMSDLALLTPKFNKDAETSIDSYHEQAKDGYKRVVENQFKSDKKKWCDAFKEKYESYYGTLVDFFKNKRNEIKEISENSILRPLEKELFEHLINGKMSITEVIDLIETLKSNLSLLENSVKDKQRNMEKKIQDFSKRIPVAQQDHLSSLGNILMSSQKKFDDFCDDVMRLNMVKTLREAFLFAGDLIDRISADLLKIKTSVEILDRTLQTIINDIDKEIPHLLSEDNTINKTRIFNKDHVEHLQKKLCKDKDKIESLSAQLRLEIKGNDGFESQVNPFERFNERYDINRLENHLIKSIDRFLKRESEAFQDYYRDMRSNIVDLLRRKYEYQEHDLVQYIKKELENSAQNVIFDNSEMGISGPDVAETKCLEGSSIFIPMNHDDEPVFLNQLKQAFTKNGIEQKNIHDLRGNPNEICITRLMNLIPARVFMRLKEYSQKYESLIDGSDAELKRYVLHTDNDTIQLPEILLGKTPDLEEILKVAQNKINSQIFEIQRSLLPCLLLLKHLDAFKSTKSGDMIQILDEDGLEAERIPVKSNELHLTADELVPDVAVKRPTPLSEKGVQEAIEDAHHNLRSIEEKIAPIQSICLDKLKSCTHEGKTETLKTRLRSEIPDDVDHPEYGRYNEAVRTAMQIIKEQL